MPPAPKPPKNDIWQDEPKATPSPWWQQDLSSDMVERIMQGIQKRDPAAAQQLNKLRTEDPERFKREVRVQGLPELVQIIGERFEKRRQERNAKFLEWLKANCPGEEASLVKSKERGPQLYLSYFDSLMKQYGHIFEADSSNPQRGAVLKEDLELKKRARDLCQQIRQEKSDTRKQTLGSDLQVVVAKRYDLILRRKEIAYEQLLKKLADLKKNVRDSEDEIAKWRNSSVKQENVRQRLQDLTSDKAKFKWD